MKYVFWGFIGLIVGGVVVVGGFVYYISNKEVDFKDAQLVDRFKETFTTRCVSWYKQKLTEAGTPPTEEQLIAMDAACKCARDPVVDALANRPVMRVYELDGKIRTDPEIMSITKACSEAAGIAPPQ